MTDVIKPKAWQIFEGMAKGLRNRHNVFYGSSNVAGVGGYSGMQFRDRDMSKAQDYDDIAKVLKEYDV